MARREIAKGNGAWGVGDREGGGGGEEERGKRWRWGDRGWRGGAREGLGWLMLFYDT